MIQHVIMPKLGETMTEAIVEKWRKAEGERVNKGDVLLEITTDKATLEVESMVSGVLRKILAPEKVTLPVNTVIALVGEPDDPLPANLEDLARVARGGVGPAIKTEAAAAAQAAVAQVETPPPVAPPGRIFASPRAKALARQEKVPLQILHGTGPGGRIVEKDVLDYLARREQLRATPVALAEAYERGIDIVSVRGSGPGGKITKEDVLATAAGVAKAPTPPKEGKVELTAMRRVVADRMAKSKREAPHFYLMMDADMSAASALRAKLNAEGKTRIAFHDLIIRACAKSLRENPAMNVAWGGDHIRQRGQVHIGLAVALDEGLIVPVVRNADRLTLAQIAEESRRLVERARSKKLTPSEYEGGCLTISNLGMYGVDCFIPVINPGESAILGVGRIAERPVVINGSVQVRSIMTMTLSADHRVVDGAIAATFLKRVKELLENPQELV